MLFLLRETDRPEEIHGSYKDPKEAAEQAKRLNSAWKESGSATRVRIMRESVAEVEAPGTLYGTYSIPVVALAAEDPRHGLCAGSWDRIDNVPASGLEWRKREMRKDRRDKLPWLYETWFRESPYWSVHFAYPASDPAKLAYTKNEEMGLEDRQTVVRPGVYLQEYFGEVLTSDEIQHWALKYAAVFAPSKLLIAHKAEDIQDVYENGPRSCMAYEVCDYDSSIHPVRAYAGFGLAVAYIENGNGIVGRSVVWPEHLEHSTIYGDIERMRDALEKAGYRHTNLDGAKLARIEDPRNGGALVVPYLDGIQRATDEGDCLRITRSGELDCDSTTGLINSGIRCCNCEGYVDEYEAMSDQNGGSWCQDCYYDAFAHCAGCYEDHPRDDSRYSDITGETYCDYCYSERFAECSECDTEAEKEDLIEGPDSELRCGDCHSEKFIPCVVCCEETDEDDRQVDEDSGEVYCEDCYAEHLADQEQLDAFDTDEDEDEDSDTLEGCEGSKAAA